LDLLKLLELWRVLAGNFVAGVLLPQARRSANVAVMLRVSTRRRRKPSVVNNVGTLSKGNLGEASVYAQNHPTMAWVLVNAALYVLSGVTQPILMSWASQAGLADPKCQLYMLFYYIGPALVALTMRRRPAKRRESLALRRDAGLCASHYGSTQSALSFGEEEDDGSFWPSANLALKAAGIAFFDIFAQSLTYTGNNMAGPTIFSIIYSSVTIWSAIFSKVVLSRSLARPQWFGVLLVVLGLSLTAMDSISLGPLVFLGACFILVGSSFHGLTYVMSEWIMTASETVDSSGGSSGEAATLNATAIRRREPEHLSIRANCSIQGFVAMVIFLLWQGVYTYPRRESLILAPMSVANTSFADAFTIMCAITLANLVHSITFYTTLKHFPGGATSAGVLKGLQAVLVFMASSVLLCGRWGGVEMCWSGSKLIALVVVVCGILVYGSHTKKKGDRPKDCAVMDSSV